MQADRSALDEAWAVFIQHRGAGGDVAAASAPASLGPARPVVATEGGDDG